MKVVSEIAQSSSIVCRFNLECLQCNLINLSLEQIILTAALNVLASRGMRLMGVTYRGCEILNLMTGGASAWAS